MGTGVTEKAEPKPAAPAPLSSPAHWPHAQLPLCCSLATVQGTRRAMSAQF